MKKTLSAKEQQKYQSHLEFHRKMRQLEMDKQRQEKKRVKRDRNELSTEEQTELSDVELSDTELYPRRGRRFKKK